MRCTLSPADVHDNVDGASLVVVWPGVQRIYTPSPLKASCHSHSSSTDLANGEASLQQRSRSSQVPHPLVSSSSHPSETSTCREIVGPPTRLSRRCPGLGNRGGDGDLASCLLGRLGADSLFFCSFIEFVGYFKRSTSLPVSQCRDVVASGFNCWSESQM